MSCYPLAPQGTACRREEATGGDAGTGEAQVPAGPTDEGASTWVRARPEAASQSSGRLVMLDGGGGSSDNSDDGDGGNGDVVTVMK